MKKKIFLVLVITCVLLTGCGKKDTDKIEEDTLNINFDKSGNEATLDYDTDNPVVALYIENYGAVVIELYPDVAPNTVNNFISLVKSGFYDDNTFHRLVKGFVLQGGDPTGTGMGNAGYNIKGEFSNNGVENSLSHQRGIVSMARGITNDSASSQFFILLGDASYLDGDYAAFGKVIDGMENVENIEKNEKINEDETLAENLKLKKALVDTKGVEYSEPEKIAN